MKNIAIIIVSFGRCELLKQTLSSLIATYDRDRASITVIDNGSQLHVIDALVSFRQYIDNIVLLNANRGKPYAWNLGVKIVNERCLALSLKRPDYFLFCDSDLSFKDGWLDTLLATYEAHKDLPLGVLSGYAHSRHNFNVKTNLQHSINIQTFPAGCCMFMRRSIYEKIGVFDDAKLIRTIDTSYYARLKEAGYKNASVHPDSVIEHTGWKTRTWNISTGEPKLLR